MSASQVVLLAASRDASCVDWPNTRSPKKIHVAIVTGELPATWWEERELIADASCDPQRMPLDMTVAGLAAEVPLSRRCQRRGCASRWPEYQERRATSGGEPS